MTESCQDKMVTLSGVVASSDKGDCQQRADPAKCWFIYTFQCIPNACSVLGKRQVKGAKGNHVVKTILCKTHVLGLCI